MDGHAHVVDHDLQDPVGHPHLIIAFEVLCQFRNRTDGQLFVELDFLPSARSGLRRPRTRLALVMAGCRPLCRRSRTGFRTGAHGADPDVFPVQPGNAAATAPMVLMSRNGVFMGYPLISLIVLNLGRRSSMRLTSVLVPPMS